MGIISFCARFLYILYLAEGCAASSLYSWYGKIFYSGCSFSNRLLTGFYFLTFLYYVNM